MNILIDTSVWVDHFRHRTTIAFAVDGKQIFIVGIFHGGQAYENI